MILCTCARPASKAGVGGSGPLKNKNIRLINIHSGSLLARVLKQHLIFYATPALIIPTKYFPHNKLGLLGPLLATTGSNGLQAGGNQFGDANVFIVSHRVAVGSIWAYRLRWGGSAINSRRRQFGRCGPNKNISTGFLYATSPRVLRERISHSRRLLSTSTILTRDLVSLISRNYSLE